MELSENSFRELLYQNHKNDLPELIIGVREPIQWSNSDFPPIHILMQQKAEERINQLIDDIVEMELLAKELRLNKTGNATTRIDLFGQSENAGVIIIELKRDKQTERQSFTELLAYANHFCSIFPGTTEASVTSILIAPMKSRTVRDAYVQELVINRKNVLALIPEVDGNNISLSVYYPDSSYYKWFENNLLDDRSMAVVSMSFPVIDGWIDLDLSTEDKSIPQYTKDALNTISQNVQAELESKKIHAFVYASQKWGELAQAFPYPNTIYVVAMNPFSSYRSSVDEDSNIVGESDKDRLGEVSEIYKQLNGTLSEFWLESLEMDFRGLLIRIVEKQFNACFFNQENDRIDREIGLPDWYRIKTSMIDAACTHNHDIFLSGLFREIYMSYIEHVYHSDQECFFLGEDMPKFSYDTYKPFLPVWEIFRALGFGKNYN
jgi:hypothetical protein